jgi:DNA-binding LacI/PurR family transcriptional regulator
MKDNTIALLTRALSDATGKYMWLGIIERCRKNNVPLITFCGDVLNQGSASILYHLFQPQKFAGAISWASSDVTQSTIDYYNNFGKTPLVCLSFRIPGHPVVLTDCKSGMEELMDHFINVHHLTKIAFIRGPESHVYARERFEGYKEALEKNNIAIDENLITPCGGWSLEDGAKAAETLLTKGLKPGVDFQAILGVGDNVAIGAQEYLLSKGYSIPDDVAVGGFNGTNEAACSNPPITSVEMPFFGQGQKSFDMLESLIAGQRVPEEFNYTTKLVIGQSCGCSSLAVKRATFEPVASAESANNVKHAILRHSKVREETSASNQRFEDSSWRNDTCTRILSIVAQERAITEEETAFFQKIIPQLIEAFCQAVLEGASAKSKYLSLFSKCLNDYVLFSSDFSIWQDFISILRINSRSVIKLSERREAGENLFQQSRVIANEFDDRIQKLASLKSAHRETTLRNIGSNLLTSYDVPTLMDIMAKSIAKLGIPGVYVVMYNNCKYTEENRIVPPTSRVILAIHDKQRIAIPTDGIEFSTTDILPSNIFPTASFYSFVIESLHFQNTFIGYLVFQKGDEDNTVYTALRDQLSSSLYGALLVTERTQVKQILEQTMQTMTGKADVVSSRSKQVSGNVTTISQSMDSVTSNIRTISGSLATVMNTVHSANDNVTEATSSINALMESTKKIENAVAMISDIAEKTNVLALNAAIEAAHAGDEGRGFSVVAKEVKSLAAQTVSSTKIIQDLVNQNNERTAHTEKVIETTNSAIKTIASLSDRIQESINEQVKTSSAISTQLQDASSGTNEISNAIEEIAKLGENLKQ